MKPGKWRLLESVELSGDTRTRDFFLRENEDGVELVMTGSEIDQLIEQEAIWRKKVAKERKKVEKLEKELKSAYRDRNYYQDKFLDTTRIWIQCPVCQGTGKSMNYDNQIPSIHDTCTVCAGEKIISREYSN